MRFSCICVERQPTMPGMLKTSLAWRCGRWDQPTVRPPALPRFPRSLISFLSPIRAAPVALWLQCEHSRVSFFHSQQTTVTAPRVRTALRGVTHPAGCRPGRVPAGHRPGGSLHPTGCHHGRVPAGLPAFVLRLRMHTPPCMGCYCRDDSTLACERELRYQYRGGPATSPRPS